MPRILGSSGTIAIRLLFSMKFRYYENPMPHLPVYLNLKPDAKIEYYKKGSKEIKTVCVYNEHNNSIIKLKGKIHQLAS